MKHTDIDSIYNEIALLSDADRDKLYHRVKDNFYQSSIENYAALTQEEYELRVAKGVEQCMKGESIGLEELSKELGYDYADL